jgi:hypothetical protein
MQLSSGFRRRKVISAKRPRKVIRGKAPKRRNRLGPTGLLGPGYLKGPKF